MAAGTSTSGSCPWTYGLDLGVALYAQVEAPTALSWGNRKWDLPGSGETALIRGGTCPQLAQGAPQRRSISLGEGAFDLDAYEPGTALISHGEGLNSSLHQLVRRAASYGPPFNIPIQHLFCPGPDSMTTGGGTACENIRGGWDDPSPILKRDLGLRMMDVHTFEKRDRSTKDAQRFCAGAAVMTMKTPLYDTSSTLLNVSLSSFVLGLAAL